MGDAKLVKEEEVIDFDVDEVELAEEQVEGTIKALGSPEKVETRWGTSYRVPLVIDIKGKEIEVSLFITQKAAETGILHPRSNAYRLLSKFKCKKLKELVGKKVTLRVDQTGFYRIVV